MARTKGTLNLSGTLEVKAGGPLDARSLVPTLADLTTAANFPYPYVGMETYVVAENKKYRLIATPVTSSSNWEEVGSGGGGGEDGGKMLTGTLLAASWSSKAQTVSVTGLKSDTIGAIGILNTATAAQVEAAREAVITPTTLANGTISFTCENVPSVDIPFGVLIPGGGSGGGSGIPDGGTTGQVLAKHSNTDGDAEWINPVSTSDCFKTTDGYMGEAPFYDGDAIPIFTGSTLESRAKKLTTWAKTKLALKAYFDTFYSTVKTRGTPASGGTALSLVTTGDMYNWNNPGIPVVANQFDKANIYSTTEKIVGCWTDGRPVYQKTVSFGALPNKTTKEVNHNISNINEVVRVFSISNDGSDGFQMIPLVGNGAGVAYQVSIKITKTKIICKCDEDMASYYPNTYITLQYTKTTDAANSFKYADENDYSTTEHIVGTWIDGKPVYQRTFSGNLANLSAGSKTTINISEAPSFLPSSVKLLSAQGIIEALSSANEVCIHNLNGTSINGKGNRHLYSGIYSKGDGTLTLSYGSDSDGHHTTSNQKYYITVQYTKTTD